MAYRTHYCGNLGLDDVGSSVSLSGWVHSRRDHGGVIFIDLRDISGIVQVVFNPEIDSETHIKAHSLRSEWVIKIEGKVSRRPKGTENPNLKTGEIEVIVYSLSVLNESRSLPFEIVDYTSLPKEEIRLKHRYLDLRRENMQKNIILRHRVIQRMRQFLDKQGFFEIETPYLIRSTPEGARDFLVPSRLSPGSFYALPQSPQLFKQILMVSGFEKYFQIARCFRDEDLRADRQPEFTQLDIEQSFVDEEDIMSLIEDLIKDVFENVLNVSIKTPFPRITYDIAMLRYGCDKPDTRFGMEIEDLGFLSSSDFNVFKGKEAIRGINRKEMGDISRSEIDSLIEFAKSCGASGLCWFKVEENSLQSPIAKFFKDDELRKIKDVFLGEDSDLILIVADKLKVVCDTLSALRLHLGKPKEDFEFLWIVEAPLFEYDEDGTLKPSHHPFTSPRDVDLPFLSKEKVKVKAKTYDVILNGCEIGGGSIRIHKPDIQRMVFSALGIKELAEKEFGFLLDGLSFGAPPHGGIALGIDRLLMVMAGCDSIRDVIAFPKTQTGTCLMTESPTQIENMQLKELGIKIL
ncbi:TPA: aspartate--tRNA ligase [bacterium]|nr:aspartate--tRNA ligase [bacterium]